MAGTGPHIEGHATGFADDRFEALAVDHRLFARTISAPVKNDSQLAFIFPP
jgi:hypothetical protein